MTDPREPKRDPQPTVAWNPEDLPDPPAPDEPGGDPTKDAAATPPASVDPAAGVPPGPAPEPPAPGGPSAGAEEDDPLVGQLLRGKWRVLERLGAGSFGTVYKVRDEKGGWIEALKILGVDRLVGSEAENMRKRFLREAQIMKRLGTESKHIVGLSTYEEDIEAGLIYFLMEHVDGRPLSDVVAQEGPFDADRVIRLALQVCDALTAAHEGPEPVVHRDLKLENLMLTTDRDGREMVKVLDFGIAKLAEKDTEQRLTTVGTLGTPGYAAPEQIRAEEVDGRTDLFAFGVILYSLLTGRDPWLGGQAHVATEQIYELMVATDRGQVLPMEDAGVSVPPALKHVVLKLMRRDPNQRFQSARELADALERIAEGGEVTDAASLQVLTDTPGVEVEVRRGRTVVASGTTPLAANALEPGSYAVRVVDPRFRRVETRVEVAAGALEDLTVVTEERGGRSTGLPIGKAAAAILLLGGAAVAFVAQPWGRALDLEEVRGLAADGRVDEVWVVDGAVRGQTTFAGIPAPFTVDVPPEALAETVQVLRAAGMEVDASWAVHERIEAARSAQARMAYFGEEASVAAHALAAAALDPDNGEARSLLLKVAQRLAWDAEAALADGDSDAAARLRQRCLELVPRHPPCVALSDAS